MGRRFELYLQNGLFPFGTNALYKRCHAYPAVILDAWSRRIVGYSVSRQIDMRLATAALHVALADPRPPRACIHHADCGS